MKGFLRPSPNGSGVHGSPVYIGLGAYPLVRLSEAREIAIDNARIASRGGDPRQTPLMIPTFAELAEVVITQGGDDLGDQHCQRLAGYVRAVRLS